MGSRRCENVKLLGKCGVKHLELSSASPAAFEMRCLSFQDLLQIPQYLCTFWQPILDGKNAKVLHHL
jgi:hypothetical protein